MTIIDQSLASLNPLELPGGHRGGSLSSSQRSAQSGEVQRGAWRGRPVCSATVEDPRYGCLTSRHHRCQTLALRRSGFHL
jgi:hypothetical protein